MFKGPIRPLPRHQRPRKGDRAVCEDTRRWQVNAFGVIAFVWHMLIDNLDGREAWATVGFIALSDEAGMVVVTLIYTRLVRSGYASDRIELEVYS